MRLFALLASVLLLAGCSRTESDAARVFAQVFSMDAPPAGVVALNGYRLERRRFLVLTDELWRLHLGGPNAKQFVRQQWPDLRPGSLRAFVQGSQTPWFAPGRYVKYLTLVSNSDPDVIVMQTDESDEVFIAYDAF